MFATPSNSNDGKCWPVPLAEVKELLTQNAGKGGPDDAAHHWLFGHTTYETRELLQDAVKGGPDDAAHHGLLGYPTKETRELLATCCRQRRAR